MDELLDPASLAPQPASHATALPARFYTDPRMQAFEERAVFARSWHLVGHVARLAEPGDHVAVDCAGLPVVVVRGGDGALRAFHNVCRHRAGPLALCDGKGAKALRCRYHGWTYGLDGVLRAATEMGSAADFVPANVRLPELRVGVWQGLVFASDGGPDFAQFTDGLDGPLRALSPQDHVFAGRASYDVACDWKVYVDNYLEGYHVPHIHPGLAGLLDYRSYVTETGPLFSYQHSPLASDDALYGSGDALYYFLYPNTMLNLLPGRLQTNRVLPAGPGRCRVEFEYYYAAADAAALAARQAADHAFAHTVQQEDVAICEQVQRGLASGSYVPGRLNPSRENAVLHFHELLRAAFRDAARGA